MVDSGENTELLDTDTDEWSVVEKQAVESMFNTPLDKWGRLDFRNLISARRHSGVTHASFDADIAIWQRIINSLPTYDEQVYYREINSMDFSIPANEHDFSKLEIVYSRLVSYLGRLMEMLSVVNNQYIMFERAYKFVKQTGVRLFAGTAKDKEASAEYLAHPFYIGYASTKTMLDHIVNYKDLALFASTNLNRILKQREEEGAVNHQYNRDGMHYGFERTVSVSESRDEIPTRKKIGSS